MATAPCVCVVASGAYGNDIAPLAAPRALLACSAPGVTHTHTQPQPALTFHVPRPLPPRSYSVVLNQKKLPMGLLSEPSKAKRMNLLTTESFQDTFGPKKRRKRPKLGAVGGDLSALVASASTSVDTCVAVRRRADRACTPPPRTAHP